MQSLKYLLSKLLYKMLMNHISFKIKFNFIKIYTKCHNLNKIWTIIAIIKKEVSHRKNETNNGTQILK